MDTDTLGSAILGLIGSSSQSGSELVQHVITSYSIHYTKLYDARPGGGPVAPGTFRRAPHGGRGGLLHSCNFV